MAAIQPPGKVKPIFGVLYRDDSVFNEAKRRIETRFGPIDYLGDPYDFIETDYYNQEMGEGLLRRFLSLEQLIYPDCLVDLKQISNLWEEQLAERGQRRINLDPGYVSLSALVLASAKNFSHRIYIGRGLYAEVTMRYEHGAFTDLPWTYPDYSRRKEIFLAIRATLKKQLH